MSTEDSEKLKVFQTLLEMPSHQVFYLRFGPLSLYLAKSETELTIKWSTSNDWMDTSFSYDWPFTGILPETLLTTHRVAFSREIQSIQLTPCLGERAFVAQPFDRLDLMPGQKMKVFMSTPMSLEILDAVEGESLAEIPVFRRPLTWFGESTIKGELCFFTNIHAALREEDMPFRPHRAMTHVNITNRSSERFPIQRLKIPVHYLSLFQRANGRFITSSIDIDLESGGKIRSVQIRPPRTNIKNLTSVAAPRSKGQGGLRALKLLELLK